MTWDSSRTWCLVLIIQLIWRSLSHMLLAVPGPQVLSMLLAPKPDAQPPAGHQLRGCWRASWKVLDLLLLRGAVLQKVSACCSGSTRSIFLLCVAVGPGQRPKWTGNALIDHADEEFGVKNKCSPVSPGIPPGDKPSKLLISFRSPCSYYICTIQVAISPNSSSLTRRQVPLITSRPENISFPYYPTFSGTLINTKFPLQGEQSYLQSVNSLKPLSK